MRDMIINPIVFSKEELDFINLNFHSDNDWNKSIFQNLKSRIIDYLRIEQDNKCCYCKRELGYDLKDVDIEHIIPKSKYPQFTFESRNLALSCPGCNTNKGVKKVLIKPVIRYPRTGKNFSIVHAHYDNYREHIEIYNNCVYMGKSDKGCDTIKYCKLFRLKNVLENAKKTVTEETNASTLVEKIRVSQTNEQSNLLDDLRKLIDEYK